MKTKRENPAPKTKRPAPRKAAKVTEGAAKDAAPKPPHTPKAPRERDPRLPAVGETITKIWRDKTLKVRCAEDGFVLDGKTYRTLSAAAKVASGFPSVNGFLFFGLIPKPSAPKGERPAKGKGRTAKPKIGGESNDIATPAGQRAALAEAGLTKKAKAAKADTTTATGEAK